MTEPHKQVSEVPLTVAQQKRGGNLLTFLILCVLIASVSVGTYFWLDPFKRADNFHHTQWPNGMPEDHYQPDPGHSEAVARMQVLADALLQYRDGPLGSGMRWPMSLDELTTVGLLEPGTELNGLLSKQPLVFQPDAPIGQDPARWVICHDVELGWQRTRTGLRVRAPVAAVVILGDGSVKLLDAEEIDLYAGLNSAHEAPR